MKVGGLHLVLCRRERYEKISWFIVVFDNVLFIVRWLCRRGADCLE